MPFKKLTQEEFIIKASIKHNYKYIYDNVIYINSNTKVIIKCNLHGNFNQTPNSHLAGQGCKQCADIFNTNRQFSNIKEFINKSNILFNNKYLYHKFNYIHNKTKSIIICKEHGEFLMTPNNHLAKQGCPKCGRISSASSLKSNKEEFIRKAIKTHNDKYDYSKVIYEGSKKKVSIICKKHGIFKQEPANHINGMGCLKCVLLSAKRIRYEDFPKHIEKCKSLHNDYYNYDKFVFTKYNTKSIIVCPKHGEFLCSINCHLQGDGCPKCNRSKGEIKVSKWLTNNDIRFEEQFKSENCKYKKLLPFDFYLPDYDLLIEYQGIQHFKKILWFKNYNFEERQLIDKIKKDYAVKNHNFLEITYKDNIDEKLQNYFEKYKHLLE